MWETVLTSILLSVATAVMGILGKVINDWSGRQKARAEEVKANDARYDMLDALEIGVINTQEAVVNEMKAAGKDGKLTKDEMKVVQERAIQEAMKVATGPGAELLVKTAFETLTGFISGIVNRKKAL